MTLHSGLTARDVRRIYAGVRAMDATPVAMHCRETVPDVSDPDTTCEDPTATFSTAMRIVNMSCPR